MSLSDSPVGAAVAVSDMESAREFYEGKLGLSGSDEEEGDGGRTYTCGQDTRLHVFPSASARASGATVAGWVVADVGTVVDELSGRGVTFERYGEPFNTDDRGIARMGEIEAAWFKDPDGNVLAVSNM